MNYTFKQVIVQYIRVHMCLSVSIAWVSPQHSVNLDLQFALLVPVGIDC